MFHISDVKIDRIVLLKAIGICALGWLAVPLIYIILKKKSVGVEKEENGKEESGRSDDQSEGAGSVC